MRPPPSATWSTTSPTGTCVAAGAGSGAPIPTPRPATPWPRRPPCTTCSTSLSLLLAPFCPFVADTMWRALTGADEARLGPPGRLARRTTPIGSTASSRRRWRWPDGSPPSAGRRGARPVSRCASPWSRALVFLPPNAPTLLGDMVAEELNVDEIDVADELGEVLEFELVPNFRTLGPRLGERVKDLKPALAALDGAAAAAALEAGRSLTVDASRRTRSSWRRRRAAPCPGPAGFRRLTGGRRGGGPRPHAGRLVASPRAGPRGGPPGPGPAQEQRAGRVGPHRPQSRRVGQRRRALRLHRPRSPGRRHRRRPGRGRGDALELETDGGCRCRAGRGSARRSG